MAVDTEKLRRVLTAGLQELALGHDESLVESLLHYLQLLTRWNRVYNLTAVRDPLQMVSRHLLDSLAVRESLGTPRRVIDVGSGAGLPGIPLALVMPESQFVLLDSSAKRCRFLTQVCAELSLNEIEIVQKRAEEYDTECHFDLVITRAFASLAGILSSSGHLLAPNGVVAAMKGLLPEREVQELPPGFALRETVEYRVPGLESASRHLLLLGKESTAV